MYVDIGRGGVSMKKKNNTGFTLVEMIVVLTIISIMMSAAIWGVMGWIEHYEYISSEEKARTIYMGAQSALSAAESRGVLDEYMKDLEGAMSTNGGHFAQTGASGLSKSTYGIPLQKDNEDVEHEYGYLTVKKGDYQAGSNNPLFDLLRDYISDGEQLNGSIIIEFDITAKKVYSVFYSNWAQSLSYAEENSEVRGDFHITKDHRKPEYREEYTVGYYSSDQVNVVKINQMKELKVKNVMLHNEDTLFLTVNSNSSNADTDTSFNIELYEKGDAEKRICSFDIDRSMVSDVPVDTPKRVELEVFDADNKSLGKYPFVLSFISTKDTNNETVYELSVMLDAMMTSQSTALMKVLDDNGRTDRVGYSITRIAGVRPIDLFARVSVEPKDALVDYAVGGSVDSNVENDLFDTKKKTSAYYDDDTAFEVANFRHLYNVRYTEDYSDVNGDKHTYILTKDLDWKDGIIYSSLAGVVVGNSFDSLDTSKIGFPTIPKLLKDSEFDGGSHVVSNVLLGNDSSVSYERNTDGTLKNAGAPINNASVVGLFGVNKGTVKKLEFKNAYEVLLSKDDYVQTNGTADDSIYSDCVEACGIVCGRCEGSISEITFDKDSKVEAKVTYKLNDDNEALIDKDAYKGKEDNYNKIFGAGVGMVSGTVYMNKDSLFDKLFTAGTVDAKIVGDDFTKTPDVTDVTSRNDILDDKTKDSAGKTNADYYAYGVGGVFGYAYGEYVPNANQASIGAADNETSIINKAEVKGVSFTGGIVGNMFVSDLADNKLGRVDGEGDNLTPSDLNDAQLINCHNYGNVTGDDYVAGIVGVNTEGSFVAKCSSYGSPKAKNGVSAGIVSENFGYVYDCCFDRASGDEYSENKDYIPEIAGNMVVAGSITCINHKNGVVAECLSAIDTIGKDDAIIISGNEMDTIGFLVGENYGVVNGGKAGEYLGYDSHKTKLTVGGAVGLNNNKAVVKNVTVTFNLIDNNQAETVGGVVGNNLGRINKCYFGGKIAKTKRSQASMSIGGIAARNGDDTVAGDISSCYVVGADMEITGTGSFRESADESTKLSKSSAIGAVCGINYKGSTIDKCYISSLFNKNGKRLHYTEINLVNGMAGGITAVNKGTVKNSGYTDKEFYSSKDKFVAVNDSAEDMKVATGIISTLSGVVSNDKAKSRAARKKLTETFIDSDTGSLKKAISDECGYIPNNTSEYKNALGKADYDISANDFVLSMSKGTGCVGGIAGFNASTGSVINCATGKWVIENYLPKVRYVSTGGVIGENVSNSQMIYNNINFAYVRIELKEIPDDDSVLNDNGQVYNKDYNNNFHYVGGVIGTQNNNTGDGWKIDRCINAGTVVNYYGNNVGGVIASVKGNGGKVSNCFNYGVLMGGYTNNYGGGYSGTAGGIISHYSELKAAQVNDVVNCENHGTVGLPAIGFDKETNKIVTRLGNATSNDVGGIVGEISAPEVMKLYIVNIKECVNGVNAKVYAHSKSAGILGTIGCYAKDGNQVKQTVNSIYVNIDSCRNYSSNIRSSQGAKTGDYYTLKNGGILSGRDEYSKDYPQIGYTAVKNCFSLRMQGYDNTNGNYTFKGGAIAYYKIGTYEVNKAPYKVYGNNYYMDEFSFQYGDLAGVVTSDGFKARVNNNVSTNISGNARLVNAFVGDGEPASPTKITSKKYISKVDQISRELKSSRFITVSYGENHNKYAVVVEPDGYDATKLNPTNSWVANDKFYVNTGSDGLLEYSIVYKFSELKDEKPYSNKLLDHFYFDRAKKIDKYKTIAEQDHNNANLDNKLKASRTPVADEFDIDYFELDNCYMDYIAECIKKQEETPDKVKNVNVTKSTTAGKYSASWEVEADGGDVPTATEFDVELNFVSLPSGVDFEPDKLEEYKSLGYVVTENKTAYGTTYLFDTPGDNVMSVGEKHYAVVRVRDLRAKKKVNADSYYSDIMDTDTIKSYIMLEPKLPEPEFEVVSYADKWMLHLKNAEDFKDYINNDNFEVGVYTYKSNTTTVNKTVKLTKADIMMPDDASFDDKILRNAVVATDIAEGKFGEEIYCYAKADGCLDAEIVRQTVYVPKNATAKNIVATLTPDEGGDNLSDSKPTYSGTLSYTYFDKWDNKDITPDVPQVFKVELYGVVNGKDSEGNDISWHETIAEDEYPVNVGGSAHVEIGYYSANSSIDLNKYSEFGIEAWYASPGQGDVYNYVETTSKWASNKLRATGFITDMSKASDTKYYFRSVKLAKPQIEIVCMGREPKWYARLINYKDYTESNTKIVLKDNNTFAINLSDNTMIDDVLDHACKLNNEKIVLKFIAQCDGFIDSEAYEYSPTNNKTILQADLQARVNVNLFATKAAYKEGTNPETTGEFIVDAQNKLTFKGMIRYNSHNDISQYYRYEIYALDDKDQEVTLYLSEDQLMKFGYSTTAYKHFEPVSVTIDDVSGYHDFKFAVWYSKSGLNNADNASARYLHQYFKISEDVAKQLAYDNDKGAFVNAREKGVLIDVTDGVDKTKYYYVTPLADERYQTTTDTTNNYHKYVLYREITQKTYSKPDVSVLLLGDEGEFIKLNNPNDYDDNVEIVVELPNCGNHSIKLGRNVTYAKTKKSQITIPYSVARSKNNQTAGKLTNLKAYAVVKDVYNHSEIASETTEKTIYMPSYTQAVPNEMRNVKVGGNDSVAVSGNNITYTAEKVSFSPNASYIPKCKQNFCVAICGTPTEAIDGFVGTTILARTKPSDYIVLEANVEKDISVSFDIDSSIDLSKFENLFVCIWYAGPFEGDMAAGGSDGGVFSELELTKSDFEANKTVNGVTIDLSEGSGNKKYYLERAFYDDKEGRPYVRGTYQKAFTIN